MHLISCPRIAVLPSLLALTLTGCMQEGPLPALVLPEATQTGQNTAGARVDGAIWRAAQEQLFAGQATQVSYFKSAVTGYQLAISLNRVPIAKNAPFDQTSIDFYVPDIRTPGTVVLSQPANPRLTTSNPAYATFTNAKLSPSQQYITGPTATGQLMVTRLDTVARIVAGTFEFTAQEAGTASTVRITEGRFDLSY